MNVLAPFLESIKQLLGLFVSEEPETLVVGLAFLTPLTGLSPL